MGQELAPAQQTPKNSHSVHHSALNSARKTNIPLTKLKQRVECEGLLKLRTTPFKNSIQIETESELLFLQNMETTLSMLLEPRMNTNKLFLLEDVQKLIESVIFTLAFLQQNHITYKDVNSNNIFYQNGVFKLLPNELIEHTTYQRLRMEENTYPSPQLLIGLKLGEEDVEEQDILEKCNVFTFGMLMLEVTTLLPSNQCYDLQNYQIFDPVLKERVILVSQYYGQKVARIIANMLDYDFTQRMSLKDLSIWINRQFQDQKSEHNQQLSSSMLVSKHVQKPVYGRSQVSHQISQNTMLDRSGKKMVKNNSVYMGQVNSQSQQQQQKQERNKIYIAERMSRMRERQYQHSNRFEPRHEKTLMPYRNQYVPGPTKIFEKNLYYQPQLNESDSFMPKEEKRSQFRHLNPYCEQIRFPREEKVERIPTKKISKPPANPYKIQYQQEEEPQQQEQYQSNHKKQNYSSKDLSSSNQYYPKISDILQPSTKGNVEKKPTNDDSQSIIKIKDEILRSKRMLSQFRRNQGLKM